VQWLTRLDLARGREMTLGTMLDSLAAAHGDSRLVEQAGGGCTLTFGEAAAWVARLAGGIAGRIRPGDRVVLATANGYPPFLLSLAVCRAGGVAVPVNPRMRPEEIEHVVRDSGAALVVHDASEVEGEPVAAAPASGRDVAALFYTSGTTGRPKGAQLSHGALIGTAGALAAVPGALRPGEAVSGMPVAHVAGFALLIMLASLGVPVYLLPRFRPDDCLDAIETRRAGMFVGVPAMYRMMLEAGADKRDLTSIRLWVSGADAMPDELARRFQRMGAAATLPVIGPVGMAAFVDGYGMVELGGGVAVRVIPPGVPGVGHLTFPLPGYRFRIVDDAGRDVPSGGVGELVVKGPGLMRGYHSRDDATSEVITGDGWLRTGDLARRRWPRAFELAGRKKDVIKHGGYSVFAVEVEQVLGEHPAVREAAVFPVPDQVKGEVPAAAVVLHEDRSVGEDELVAWAAERLSDYKVPRLVGFVDDLPRTGTDKVQKRDLPGLLGWAGDRAASAASDGSSHPGQDSR
jgi:acyl-CoA synthetase (AMP-forming)/AMP-acid ligase II